MCLGGCSTSKNLPPKDKELTIAFAGDVMLARLVDIVIKKNGPRYPWGNILDILNNADFRIVNLENTFTTSTRPELKVFNFKSHPDNVHTLREAHIDLVSLANNHTKDFGDEGLLETIKTLDNAAILHVGAGTTITHARRPVIITKNNIKIGILGATDNEPTWQATKLRPGINYFSIDHMDALLHDIAHLRQQVDIVIISLHWGPNMRQRPTQEYIDAAHQMINAGADIIHGHSAHIFQGIELYNSKLIMYDTGDFVDDYQIDPVLRNDQSILVFVTVDKKEVKQVKVIPLIISNMQVNQAEGSEASSILKKIQALSVELSTQISDEGILTIRI